MTPSEAKALAENKYPILGYDTSGHDSNRKLREAFIAGLLYEEGEIKRLKRLIEGIFKSDYGHASLGYAFRENECEKDWQQFKTENNL